jgi:hypothetical protein
MSERFRIRKVIHRDNIDIGIVEGRAIDIAPDTAEAVNTYFDCHCASAL